MKKILTFLVMLVACVSILSAQTSDVQIPQARFNYQAVVRDWNNSHNLVMGQPVKVTVEIFNGIGSDAVFTEEHNNLETNRNGMVSFIIGENATGVDPFANVNWGIAIIKATFRNEAGDILSVVENPVMAVPYALQANVDPLEITTEEIVKYIQHAEGTDVKAIYDAMVSNQSVSKAVRDSIVSYVKTQDSLAKALAIYFLHTVNADDVEAARDTLTQSAKNAIKNIVIDYLKANKDAAYDVLGYYLTNTTVEDADALWDALKDNSQFETIFTQVRDKAINYIKNNKDLVLGLVYYYIDEVITGDDVEGLHNRLKQNTQVYNYMLGKFNDYLDYYIGDNYLRDAECGVNLCELKNQFDDLKNNCPTISEAKVLSLGDDSYKFTASITGNVPTNITTENNVLTVKTESTSPNENPIAPATNTHWQFVDGHYQTEAPYTGSTTVKFIFTLNAENCQPSTYEANITTPDTNTTGD